MSERVTVRMTPAQVEALDALKSRLRASSRADVIREALAMLGVLADASGELPRRITFDDGEGTRHTIIVPDSVWRT